MIRKIGPMHESAASITGGLESKARSGSRLLYLDNLRWTVIVLVISMHAADTYSPLGNWYFVDRAALTRPQLLFFAAWQMYLQAFFMGLLFFIAGYFVPASLARKGRNRYVRDRLIRLGLPVLFYMFVLGPLTEYYFAHSWTSDVPTSFTHEWLKHILNGQFLQENGPLWFCLALLIFTLLYVLVRPSLRALPVPGTREFIAFALLLASSIFLVRLILPPGFTLLNMHLDDFPQYVLLFAAGVSAGPGGWLDKLSLRTAARFAAVVLPVGFAGWLALLYWGGALAGRTADYAGGWHWQALLLNIWEGFTCVALCAWLLAFYRDKFDRQRALARFLSANAFSVYVFHPPIVIAAARALHSLDWSPLPKFGLLTGVAAIVSFLLSAAVFRRLPLVRRIL